MTAAVLFVCGLISLVGQIVLLRELNVASYGIELVYLIALGLWLLLAALGTLLGRRKAPASPGPAARLLLLFSLFLPLGCVFIRGSRLLFGGVPGAYLAMPLQMASLSLALLPTALLSGLLFRCAADSYLKGGRTLAGAYGIESAGALAGGILATLAMRFGIQNFPLALACGLISAAAALPAFRGRRRWPLRLASLGIVLLMALLIGRAAPLDRAMTSWNHPGLLASGDSPYGRISVTARSGQVSVFVNDTLAFETEGAEAELLAHLAALQHPAPRRILLLGGGINGTLRELLRHHPTRIDWVEIDRIAVAMARPYLPEEIQASLAHPAVHLIVADPRRFLKKSGALYDLILIGMPEPSSGQANRFYTEEFFHECAGRLAPGGIVALGLPTPENFWTPQLVRRTASVQRALASVLPKTLLLPGEAAVITASRDPLPSSPETLEERLRERGIQTRLVTAPYIHYLFTNDRRNALEKRLRQIDVAMNTDVHPVCYPYAVTIWLARFFPKLALAELPHFGREGPGFGEIPWMIVLGAALLLLMSRLWPSLRRWLLVAMAGLIGIVFEALLILAYQAKEGALYQEIGLLLAAFMAGLTLGACLVRGAIRGTDAKERRARRWGVGLIAGFALIGAAVYWSTGRDAIGGLMPTAALLAADGFIVAGLLAYAGLHGIADQRKVVVPLYTADLIGGCLGSLLGSLLLIPALGLDGTAAAMILLAALSLLLA
jgi:spermidine synthase